MSALLPCGHFKHFSYGSLLGACAGQKVTAIDSNFVTFQEIITRQVPLDEVAAAKNQINNKISDYEADHSTDIANLGSNLSSYDTIIQ